MKIVCCSVLNESAFSKLDLVDYFSVADNALMQMPRHVIRHMPHVKTLDLRRNKMTKLTEDDFRVLNFFNNLLISFHIII